MTHQYPPTNHRNDVTRIDSEFCFSSSPFIENLKSTILKYIYSISAHSMVKNYSFVQIGIQGPRAFISLYQVYRFQNQRFYLLV